MVDWTSALFAARGVTGTISSFLVIALAVWVVWVDPRSRIHRGVFLLLLFLGLSFFLSSLSNDPRTLPGTLWFYAVMAIPFIALYIAFEFIIRFGKNDHQILRKLRPLVVTVLIAGAGAVWLAFMNNHDLLWDDQGKTGPLAWMIGISQLSRVFVAIVIGWEATRVPPSLQRRALHIASLSFLLIPAFTFTDYIVSSPRFLVDGRFATIDLIDLVIIPLLGFAMIGVLLSRTLWMARRTQQEYLWQQSFHVGFAFLIPALLAIATNVYYEMSPQDARAAQLSTSVTFMLHHFLLLSTTFMLAFAVLRCNLLRVEFNAKRFLTGSALTAASGFVYFLATEGLEAALANTNFGGQAWVGSIIGAGIIAILLLPFLRGARALADVLMPGVEDSERHFQERGFSIYEAALDGAWRDGEVTARERAAIERLGANLGLTMSQMRSIEADHPGNSLMG